MKTIISARINEEVVARLDQACDRENNPYAPAKSSIIERGIELALKELEKKK